LVRLGKQVEEARRVGDELAGVKAEAEANVRMVENVKG